MLSLSVMKLTLCVCACVLSLTVLVPGTVAQRSVHDIVSSCERTDCNTPPFCFGFSCENADAGDQCFARPSLESCPDSAFVSVEAQGDADDTDHDHDHRYLISLVAAKGDWVGLIVAEDSSDVWEAAKVAFICMLNPINTDTDDNASDNDNKTATHLFYVLPSLNLSTPHAELQTSSMFERISITRGANSSNALVCEFTVNMKEAPDYLNDLPSKPYKIGFFGGTGNVPPDYITSSNKTLNYFTRLGVSGSPPRFGSGGWHNFMVAFFYGWACTILHISHLYS